MRLFQEDAVPDDDSLIERKPRLGTVPVREFTIACSYDRRELGDVKLLRVAVFECSKSGSRSTVLGVRLRFGFPMP